MVLFSESKKFNRLANLLKCGDKTAAAELFDYFNPKLFSFFITRTLHRETAEDLTQEVFLKLINHIDTFSEKKGDFLAWIWQIARNTAKDYYRKNSKKEINVATFIGKYESFDDRNELENKIRAEEVMKLVRDFSEEEQEIFSMYYLSDLPYKEISRIIGKPEGSLRVLIHRINQKIKQKYERA